MSTICDAYWPCKSYGDTKAVNADMMPDFMTPILNAMPLTYLRDSLRQIMVDASAQHPHYGDLAVLGGWFLVCLIGAVRLFRWEWPDRVHPRAAPCH